MRAILLPAPRRSKSSRGTPRLRHPPRTLHGALRLAALTTARNSWLRLLADTGNARVVLTFSSIHPSADVTARSALLLPVAASGGFLACLDWPALTPALTEIRLLLAACRLAFSCHRSALGSNVPIDPSWLLDSRRQAHFLLERHTTFCLMPNVRVEAGPTASHQPRAGENVQRTTGPGLVACRWASPRTRG